MILINELIIPFKDDNIDFDALLNLIDLSFKNSNDYVLAFTNFCEGNLLSLKEKIELIDFVNRNEISNFIFYFQLSNKDADFTIIDHINNSMINTVFISPPLDINYDQNGLFLLTKKYAKALKNKDIYIVNSPKYNNTTYHFQTIKKLYSSNENIKGLYENSKDYSLLYLIRKNLDDFKLLINDSEIVKGLSIDIDGFISLSSLIFGETFKDLLFEHSHGFIDKLTLDYLVFANEILKFNNNSTLMKIYLKKLNYQSMNVRLPLIINIEDENNLDFLLS